MSKKRVAYVTGGMGGIGSAICRRFHDMGYTVVAGCGPTRDHAKWLTEQKADGYSFHASVGNVADWESTKAAFEKVRAEVGTVDILVNNAGITRDGVFRRMSLDDWRAVMDTNLNSLFNVTKQVIDGMLDQNWGRIINISSVVAIGGNPGQANYGAAKAGVIGMSKCLAGEVATRGITVNCIAPGFITTAMTDKLTEEQKAKLLADVPAGRMGDPVEIAAAALYLASPEAGYVTGSTLHVNGGMAMV